MYVIVCGGGVLGAALAQSLVEKKEDVVVIEPNRTRTKHLAATLDALVINGSATEKNIMEQAGVDKAEVLVAATGDDTKNLMISQLAKKSNVRKVIARVNESSNLELFVGIADVAIDITAAAVSTFTEAVSISHEHVLAPVAGGRGKLLQIPITNDSPVRGVKAKDLPLEKESKIVLLDRNGQLIFELENLTLFAGDILYIVAKSEEVGKINKKLVGA